MKETLLNIGLSSKEASVYLALLELESSNVSALSKKTGINRVTVYPVLERLISRGLVNRFRKKGKWQFFIEDPRRLRDMQLDRLAKVEKIIPQLMVHYQSGIAKPEIRFYEGKQGLNTLFFDSLHNNKNKEILFSYPAWDILDILGKEEVELYVRQRVELGIKVKALRQFEKEVSLQQYPFLASTKEVLRQVRLVPEGHSFSVLNALYDDRIAFFASSGENFGLLLISPSLSELMRAYFLALWNTSKPLS